MTTITISDNTKILKNNFNNIEELKIYIYEFFGYPNINDELEKKYYKKGKIDLCKEEFLNTTDMKNFYLKLRKFGTHSQLYK